MSLRTLALLKTTSFLSSRRCLSISHPLLSGHNKWSKIKRDKAVADQSKSLTYSKSAAEITAAARRGGSIDPEINVSLALALAKAKKLGVPKDNVEAALKRGAGAGGGDSMQEVTYEALGPAGVPLLIDCLTDNPTRTIARVKEMLNKYGGRMADVRYMFEPKAVVHLTPRIGHTSDEIFDLAIEGGAEEVDSSEDGEVEITGPPSVLHSLTTLLAPVSDISSSEIVQLPTTSPADGESGVDEHAERQLEGLEKGLEEYADCIRLWRAA